MPSAKAPPSKDKNPTRQRSLADFFNPRGITSSSPAPSSSTASTPRAKKPAVVAVASSPVERDKVMAQVGVQVIGKGKGREVLEDEDGREASQTRPTEAMVKPVRALSDGASTSAAAPVPDDEEEEDEEVTEVVRSLPAPAAIRTPSVEAVEEELQAPATSATLVDVEDLEDGQLGSTPRPPAVPTLEMDVPGSGSDMSMSSVSPNKARTNGSSASTPSRPHTHTNSLPEPVLDLPPSDPPTNSDMSISSGSPFRPRATGTPIATTPLQQRYDPLPSPLPALRTATNGSPRSNISLNSPRPSTIVRLSNPLPSNERVSSPIPSSPSFHTASAGSFEDLPHPSSQQLPSSHAAVAIPPSSPLSESSDYDLPSPSSHASPSRTPARRPAVPFSTPGNTSGNPKSDSSYAREPSGSPLSELEESPVKRNQGWRRHTFELVVVHKRKSWAQEDEEMRAQDKEEDEEVEASLRSSQVPKEDDSDDGQESNSDNGSDSDGEAAFLAGILARAAARVGAGTTLTPVSNSLSTPIFNPFDIPDSPVDRRRSGRVSLSSVRGTDSIPMKARIKSVDMGFGDLSSGGGGKYGLKAMQSERRVGKGGVGISAWEEGKRLLDDEDDSGVDEEEAELEVPNKDPSAPTTGYSTPHVSLSSTHVSAMRSIVEDSASYSQEATSPQKREALLKVRAMEDVLVEETKGRPMAVSGVRDDDDREFWREDVRVVPYVLAETQESAGMWEATILLAIRAALVDPSLFPSPITLCSRLRGHGTAVSRSLVAQSLLSLVAHPFTDKSLAEQAIQLLHRLAQHTSTLTDEAPSTLLGAQEFYSAFKVLGAKQEAQGGDVDVREETIGRRVLESQRNGAVLRICRVIQGLSITSRRILNGSDTRSLLHLLISLSLSTTSAPLRTSLEKTLQSLTSTIAPSDLNLTKRLIKSLVETYYDQSARVQVEVLRVLPRGGGGKVLRKWVSWCWLLKKETGLSALTTKPISKPPPLQPLISALQTPREGYFSISDTMNDSELYSRTLVLTIALTDLGDMYLEGGKVMMEGIRNLGGVLSGIEQRIRTNIRSGNPERNRAKNALTRLIHSLDYQVKVGSTQVGLEEISSGEEDRDGEEEKEEQEEKVEVVVVKRRKPNRGPEARGEVALV